MTRRTVALLALLTAPLVTITAAEFTVLSFNVRSARGDGEQPEYRAEHLDELVRMINEIAPDAVLLQEIDRGVERSNRIDQFAFIVEQTGMTGRFAHTVDYQGGRFGIAVLTRHEIIAYNRVLLPRLGGKEPRALQHLRVRVGDGSELDLFNTHIDPHPVSGSRQISIVLEETAALAIGPAVLGGDFNAPPQAGSIRRITDSWQDAAIGGTSAPTFPAHSPRIRVDYLFLTGEAISLREFRSPDHRGISDHTPLLAHFELSPD